MSRVATPKDLVNEPCRVLGTMLRPFSLGHHLLFTKLGLGFAGNPYYDSDPPQLAMAVFLCAAPHSDVESAMVRDEWADEFSKWAGRLKPKHFWSKPTFNHSTEASRFCDYLEAGYQRPPIWKHETASSVTLSAPWECLLKCRLISGGYSEREALEKYLPAAWYDYFTLLEIDQAANSVDPKRWRKIFFTEADNAMLNPN